MYNIITRWERQGRTEQRAAPDQAGAEPQRAKPSCPNGCFWHRSTHDLWASFLHLLNCDQVEKPMPS